MQAQLRPAHKGKTMQNSTLALLGFAAWTLALLGGIAVLRGTLVSLGKRAANSFAVTGEDVSAFSARLCRAHANCYENLPAFACLVLIALVTGHGEITEPLALYVLAARVAQSTSHLISTRSRVVLLRFAFLLVQYVIQVAWIVQLLRAST
jgi:uncharacterized MAPEG superfamily protein